MVALVVIVAIGRGCATIFEAVLAGYRNLASCWSVEVIYSPRLADRRAVAIRVVATSTTGRQLSATGGLFPCCSLLSPLSSPLSLSVSLAPPGQAGLGGLVGLVGGYVPAAASPKVVQSRTRGLNLLVLMV